MTTRRHQSHNPMGPARNYRTRPLLANILTWDEHPATPPMITTQITTQPTKNPSPTTHPHRPTPQPHQPTLTIDTNHNPEWRIHNITPVRTTIEGWDDPDRYYTTDDNIDWIPLTDTLAYNPHPHRRPLTQRFIETKWYTNNGNLNETE